MIVSFCHVLSFPCSFLLSHVFLTSPRCDRGICSQSITTITSLKKLRLTTRRAVQWHFLSARILCTFNTRRCKKPFENHKKFRTSKSEINCTVNAGTKSGKFVCLGICSYLLPKIFCRVFHLFIKFFDLQHLFITPGLGQTYSQSLCQQRTEMGVAVHVFSK